MHRWGNKKDMVGDDPPYLSVGTEVSAKYKGAFCEAKIRKVVKSVKCKVQYKNEQGSVFVNDEQIKGLLMHGASVEVRQADRKETAEGTIVRIRDLSQYTVVFDDGDIATLRRTALRLKSGRHFAESETLDQLPLTHPEHFSTPVVSGSRGSRRRDEMDENSEDEEKQPEMKREEDMGKVVCVEIGDKKKSKDNWFPGLVVAPTAQDSSKIDVEEEYLIRSFKDGRYYTVPKSETVEFTRDMGVKVDNATLKEAVGKANSFLDKSDLPPHWDRDQLFGTTNFTSDNDASDSDSMDDEPREEKDHFVAQLYKFMDDRGTPINKGPTISSKDVDLYKLFKIVYKLGGYNRVTNRNQWKAVAIKLGYNVSQTNTVRISYKKYLHSFEDFYRKLGCTLLTTSRDNKLRSRSSRPLIRDRDKTIPEKNLDKDEQLFSNNEDSMDSIRSSKVDSGQLKDEEDLDTKIIIKKEKEERKLKNRDNSTESIKEKKFDNVIKENNATTSISMNDIKDEKNVPEKKVERKSMKLLTKLEDGEEKKINKFPMKMKNKKTKPVEKRIKKTEGTIVKLKEKRSIREKMKGMVHKLKLKTTLSSDQDKPNKKQKTPEELTKMMSHGVRVKLKDELENPTTKSRKLSVGSNDSKSSGSGHNNEKKSSGLSNSLSNVLDVSSGASGSLNRLRKSDDEVFEATRKKTNSRKKKEDDKTMNVSVDSMNQAIEFVPHYKTILIGDKLRVYYEPTHESKVTYEAKVTNKRYGNVTEYLVHYTGWNTRYDEWIRRSRIADNLSWTPSRTKRKLNQIELTPVAQASTSQEDIPGSIILQSNGKVEKVKRSSVSPMAKNRAKLSLKSGIKQMKNFKNRLESKSKKTNSSKDSDIDSDVEEENSRKQELQKTRSRTERRKQLEEDSNGSKESTEVKKKGVPLKRTRSGSIKLESKEITKKRKMSPTAANKTNKTNTIRNSIMKTFGPRRRAGRLKDSKDEKDISKFSPATTDAFDDDIEEGNDIVQEVKCIGDPDKMAEDSISAEGKFLELKIPHLTPEKIKEELECLEIADVRGEDVGASVAVTCEKSETAKKKDTVNEEETNVARPQIVTDSYLAENIDSKPKIVKGKPKKEPEEKVVTPPKNLCRSPSDKSGSKSADMKEKTIFTSRSPSERKNDRTPEKEAKRISTFSSYLSMDKIDSIKKCTPDKTEKMTEKMNVIHKIIESSVKREDDIYEFSEPEPLNIDDRAMLHRRTAPRIFEDPNFKRTKPISSMDSLMKEVEDSESVEDMNCVEIKSIPQPQKDDNRSSQDTDKVGGEDEKIRDSKSKVAKDGRESSEPREDGSNKEPVIKIVDETVEVSGKSLTSENHSLNLKRENEENSADWLTDKSDEDEKPLILDTEGVIKMDDGIHSVTNLVSGNGNANTSSASEEVSDQVDVSENSAATNKDTVPIKKLIADMCSSKSSKTKLEACDNQKPEDSNDQNVNKKSVNEVISDDQDGSIDSNASNAGEILDKIDRVSKERIQNESQHEKMDVDDSPESEEEKLEQQIGKTKEEENTDGGHLLCEETIPKSPEIRENMDADTEYSCSNRSSESRKHFQNQPVKNKELKHGLFDNSSPTSPEGSNSTPGTSPSGEASGFSTATFSLNEKSCGSHKDSSENETSSDASEKPVKIKKYGNEAYEKKSSYEYDTYMKKRTENEKPESFTKKRSKIDSPSVNGSDIDDESNASSSPRAEVLPALSTVPPKKSSIANILAEIPPHFDSNQRIEFLEQKMQQIRKRYNAHKQEVASIDRKRKKLRRREREGRMMTRNEANLLL